MEDELLKVVILDQHEEPFSVSCSTNDKDFVHYTAYVDRGIKYDNEAYQRLIKRGRFKMFAEVLKKYPFVISRETFSVLADFLLKLPETGKRGRKANSSKQREKIAVYEEKKGKRLSADPIEDKKLKAAARQARSRRNKKHMDLQKILSETTLSKPATKGLTES